MANASRIQIRKDTAANLSSAVLATGELGLETDTSLIRVGNGSSVFGNLPAVGAATSYQVIPYTPTQSYGLGGTTSSLFPYSFGLDAGSIYEVEMHAVFSFACTTAATNDVLFQMKYNSSFTMIGGTGGVSRLYLTLVGTNSKIAIGMVVSGTGISGSPTVVAYDGNRTVTLSSFQTVAAGTTLTFSSAVPSGGIKNLLTVEGAQRTATAAAYGGSYAKYAATLLGGPATNASNTIFSSMDSDASGGLSLFSVVPLTASPIAMGVTTYVFTIKVKGIIVTDASSLTNVYPSIDVVTSAGVRSTGTVTTATGSYIKYSKLGRNSDTVIGNQLDTNYSQLGWFNAN